MCGIVGGMSHELDWPKQSVIRDLFVLSNIRGRDGSGSIIIPKGGGEPTVIRTLGSGIDLIDSQEFWGATNKPNPSIIVGHTRWPTKGAHDDMNAVHPHEVEHIVGVHNGTMKNVLRTKVKDEESDSFLLYKAIAEKGLEETIQTSEGSYALVWVDKKQETLNFLRNGERPLWLGQKGDDGKTLYWASEPRMLYFVLGSEAKILAIPPSQHHAYRLNIKKDKQIGWVERKTVEFIRPKVTHFPKKKAQAQSSEQTVGELEVAHPDQIPHQTYLNSFVPRDELSLILCTGCAFCGDPYDLSDYYMNKCHFISSDEFLCSECVEGPASAWRPMRRAEPTIPATIKH